MSGVYKNILESPLVGNVTILGDFSIFDNGTLNSQHQALLTGMRVTGYLFFGDYNDPWLVFCPPLRPSGRVLLATRDGAD
jgi:hypothetical protein